MQGLNLVPVPYMYSLTIAIVSLPASQGEEATPESCSEEQGYMCTTDTNWRINSHCNQHMDSAHTSGLNIKTYWEQCDIKRKEHCLWRNKRQHMVSKVITYSACPWKSWWLVHRKEHMLWLVNAQNKLLIRALKASYETCHAVQLKGFL